MKKRDTITKRIIADAKRNLYSKFLQMDPDMMTESEVDLAYRLCLDADIQKILTKALKDKPPVVLCDGRAHSKLQEVHGGKR